MQPFALVIHSGRVQVSTTKVETVPKRLGPVSEALAALGKKVPGEALSWPE